VILDSIEAKVILRRYCLLSNMRRYEDVRGSTSPLFSHGLRRPTEAAAVLLGEIDRSPFRLLDVGAADGAMLNSFKEVFPSASFAGLERGQFNLPAFGR
jgi:hypothetical protein